MTSKEDTMGAGIITILSIAGMFVGYYSRDILFFVAYFWVFIWAVFIFEVVLLDFLRERKERRREHVG